MRKIVVLFLVVLCMCSCRFMYNRSGDESELKPSYIEKYTRSPDA